MKKRYLATVTMVMILLAGIFCSGCGKESIAGVWIVDKLQVKDEIYTQEDIEKAKEEENVEQFDMVLEVNEDQTYLLRNGQETVAEGEYHDEGDGWVFNVRGMDVDGYMEGEQLVLHDTKSLIENKMFFNRQS